MVHAAGKAPTTVFISHEDPDFYFDRLRAACRDVKSLTIPEKMQEIEKPSGRNMISGADLGRQCCARADYS